MGSVSPFLPPRKTPFEGAALRRMKVLQKIVGCPAPLPREGRGARERLQGTELKGLKMLLESLSPSSTR